MDVVAGVVPSAKPRLSGFVDIEIAGEGILQFYRTALLGLIGCKAEPGC